MKLLLSWLNEYVDTKGFSAEQLADNLVNIGFEVEGIEYLAGKIDNVFTGKIIEINKHPNAERLQLCKLDFGKDKEVLQIVTAAKNVAVGDIVPVALDGASLFDGSRIYNGELRGEKSYGMLCGGNELGVSEDWVVGGGVDGILILDKKTKVGQDIKKVLDLDEYVLDVSLTANRPDCQSVYGLAREVAVMLKREIKPLNLKYKAIEDAKNKPFSLEIKDSTLCPRYMGTSVRNIKIALSPDLIKKRLKIMGVKSINNIVDITNYVLLEVGQPLHAFDASLLEGGIVVRNAKDGEKITLLNGEEIALKSDMLVIADKVKAVALAGIMGGSETSVSDSTTEILLESANFAKGNIRNTARALGLKTDSSHRNEKGVDYFSVEVGTARALALIYEHKIGDIIDVKIEKSVEKPKPKVINISIRDAQCASPTSCVICRGRTLGVQQNDICDLLGIKIPTNTIVDILTRLGFKVQESKDGEKLKVTAPNFRTDIESYACLAEEVIRFYGYDKIIASPIKGGEISQGGYSIRDKNINALKSLLVGMGCFEAITYSFVSNKHLDMVGVGKDSYLRDEIEILNPLSSDYSRMRTTLVPSMLHAVRQNEMRKHSDFRLFEIANVYVPIEDKLPIKTLPTELDILCIAFVGKNEDFYSLKIALKNVLSLFMLKEKLVLQDKDFEEWLHPSKSANIIIEFDIGAKNSIKLEKGCFGAIHPKVAKNFDISENVYILELNLSGFIEEEVPKTIAQATSKFPPVTRDLALVVKDDILVGELVNIIKKTVGEICKGVEVFDIYKGEQVETGYKSVALSVVLQSDKATLKDNEIVEVMNKIISNLESETGAKLRA
ncbi:MAG: phenylalanine--tRNA ligase subunit beta [Firmicutes bacterium]|nr:phenylalanine--tRNA ligase subunit beta [Bacillota bacterium]